MSMTHQCWTAIIMMKFKRKYVISCGISLVHWKPRDSIFASYYWQVSANSAKWVSSASWITCRISAWGMITVLSAASPNKSCARSYKLILNKWRKPTKKHTRKPVYIWNNNMTAIISVRTVKIFIIHSVCSMLLHRRNMPISGFLPGHLLF